MAFMHQNTNLFLLWLIVFAGVGMVSMAMFFNVKFESFNQQMEQMQSLSDKMAAKDAAIADAQSQLDLKDAQQNKLAEILQSLRDQNKSANDQNAAATVAVESKPASSTNPVIPKLANGNKIRSNMAFLYQ